MSRALAALALGCALAMVAVEFFAARWPDVYRKLGFPMQVAGRWRAPPA